MSLENQLAELKYDYVRLQGDIEKRESLNLDTSALVLQLKDIENEIRNVRAQMQD
ncbi:TPA: SE1832 family protein [Staphylococcus aureus]